MQQQKNTSGFSFSFFCKHYEIQHVGNFAHEIIDVKSIIRIFPTSTV